MVDMGNVWDRTTEFLSDNVRALMPIALVALLIPQSISALVAGAAPAVNPLAAQGITLVCALIALWGQLAVVALALDPDRGRAGAASAATAGFARAVVAMLVLFAALVVLALPIVAVLAASGVDLTALHDGGAMAKANLSGASSAFLVVYGIALLVVAVVVTIRLALLYPVVLAEGLMVGAIRRAFVLGRGIVWKMIGVWLLFVIVYLVASVAVTSAIGVVIGLFTPISGPFAFGRIVVAILGGIVTMTFTLIVAAFSAKLYRAVAVSPASAVAA